jgi:hypothetical protein
LCPAVIYDNTWLWRAGTPLVCLHPAVCVRVHTVCVCECGVADHTVSGLVFNSSNPVQNGLVVTGDNVIAYGLAVEHTLGDLVVRCRCCCCHCCDSSIPWLLHSHCTVTMHSLSGCGVCHLSTSKPRHAVVVAVCVRQSWEGENGKTFFFQSELPYDVTPEWCVASVDIHGCVNADCTSSHALLMCSCCRGDKGFVGYRVGKGVTQHQAYGVGVYHYFRDFNVTVASGIACPDSLVSSFVAPLSVYLNGGGIMQHIINDIGNESGWNVSANAQYVC